MFVALLFTCVCAHCDGDDNEATTKLRSTKAANVCPPNVIRSLDLFQGSGMSSSALAGLAITLIEWL